MTYRRPTLHKRLSVTLLGASAACLLVACSPQELTPPETADDLLAAPANAKGDTLRSLGFASAQLEPGSGQAVFLGGRVAAAIASGEDARAFVMNHLRSTLRLGSGSDFQMLAERRDEQGFRYLVLRQVHNGVPVREGGLVLQVAEDGAVLAVIGRPLPQLRVATTPQLSGERALELALTRLAGDAKKALVHEAPQLLIHSASDGQPVLAYHAAVEYQGESGHALEDLYIDANSGTVVGQISRIHSGLTRNIYDGKKACLSTGSELPGTKVLSEGGPASTDESVKGAYDNTGTTYWFYKNYFGRDSYDNRGSELKSSVHFTFSTGFSCDGANAAWLGSPYLQMVYGDGDATTFKPLALSLDVTAHELTHAVTNLTSNLDYQNESGALNEAMSDIFGAVTEAWKASGGSSTGNPADITASANTWKVGEDVARAGLPGGALRFMNNPTADGYSKDYYPERITGTSDNGGVHGNSGIANLAFYLLSQGGSHPRGKTTTSVTGIGIAKAAKVFYKANSELMTASSKFQDARNTTAQAAKTLYGDCSAEWENTQKAWDAVGVPGTWTRCGTGGDTTAPTVSLTAPTAGATVSGTVTISASAMDNVGVAAVEFYSGTTLIGTDTSSPYSVSWDSKSVTNGAYSLTAKAKDAAGNVGSSAAVSVTVSNMGTGGGGTQNEAEPNGSFSQANTVSTAGTTVSGTVTSKNDDDYFKLTLPAGKSLAVTLTPPAASDFDLYVYDLNKKLVASSEKGVGLVEQINVINDSAVSEVVYVYVKGYSGYSSTNRYSLKLVW
ncbi:MAG: M4 family metallopeptidase [Polyangia bacterium]